MKKNTKKISLFGKILLISNFIFIGMLFFAYFSTLFQPNFFSFLSLFGLGYPLLLLANLAFAVFWIFRKKWYAFFSFVAIILGWSFLSNTFQINILNQKNKEPSFKLMSYNVRLFNKYNWNKNDSTAIKILDYFSAEKPDILCLQEFYSDKSDKNLYYHQKIQEKLKFEDYFISYGKKNGKKYNYGIATYTKYRIINEGVIKFENEKDISIFTDIVTELDTFRLYNCHFQSIKLGYDDYDFIDNIENDPNGENHKISGIFKILRKINSAYKIRGQQVSELKKHLKSSPYKTIICGDFNDVPVSFTYSLLAKNKTDAFKRSGQGIGSTYIRNYSFFRIDYILHSKAIKSYNYQKHRIKYSDHYPISCEIVF